MLFRNAGAQPVKTVACLQFNQTELLFYLSFMFQSDRVHMSRFLFGRGRLLLCLL